MIHYGLDGRVILVTGGGSGIGRAAGLMAAASGAAIGVGDVRAEAAEAVAAEITAGGGRALALPFDVADDAATEAAFAACAAALGEVDGLVACAGISRPAAAEDIADADWDAMMAINLTGCFLSCRAAGRSMLRLGRGSIVTIASTDALGGHSGRLHYAASKHGVVGITKTLALEWGRFGVRVNSVAPGPVDTPLLHAGVPGSYLDGVLVDRTPLARLADATQLAHAILFLLSDAAAQITGVLLPVDGGMNTGYFNRWHGADLGSQSLLDSGAYAVPAGARA
jgi:NAD(P)-dependent dehydrogenase (short-subunit alcohol dehydrogenase family)